MPLEYGFCVEAKEDESDEDLSRRTLENFAEFKRMAPGVLDEYEPQLIDQELSGVRSKAWYVKVDASA